MLRKMLHLKTELMVGVVAVAAVEQILVGEGFADVTRLVFSLRTENMKIFHFIHHSKSTKVQGVPRNIEFSIAIAT